MFRMYIDETGSEDMGASHDENHRYLSLTGLIIDLDVARDVAVPGLEQIKRDVFNHHPDDPLILHRKDIVQQRKEFRCLRDDVLRQTFNSRIIALFQNLPFTAVTVAIDKLEHLTRYGEFHKHPYHYCLEVLLERYFFILRDQNAVGDVMSEARGKREDKPLKQAYKDLFSNGNQYIAARKFQSRLSSKELKVKEKHKNIAGLQLADLVAHPSFIYTRSIFTGGERPDNFGSSLVDLMVESKYYRGNNGVLERYGIKWLP